MYEAEIKFLRDNAYTAGADALEMFPEILSTLDDLSKRLEAMEQRTKKETAEAIAELDRLRLSGMVGYR